jgi:hypothetical protein
VILWHKLRRDYAIAVQDAFDVPPEEEEEEEDVEGKDHGC